MFFPPAFWPQGSALHSTVRGAGKRQSRSSVAAVDAAEPEELLFVKDSWLGKRFLVDSISQKSLLPPSDSDLSSRGSGPH